MNLDLIQKLIRLANNNPNDNEANLAARKVCSLLKDYKFNSQLPNQPPIQQNPYTQPQQQSSWSRFDNDLDWLKDYFTKRSEGTRYNPYTEKWNYSYKTEPFYPFSNYINETEKEKSKKEKKPLKCSRCQKVFLTGFVGPPQMFKCNVCYWEIYREEQELKNAKPPR